MTYEAVEASLATYIRALSAFADDQVSVGDFRISEYGHPHAVILEYNAFRAARDTYQARTLVTWTTRVHLLAKYTDDVNVHNALRDRRDELILQMLQNPTLGGTAFDAMPVRGEVDDDEEVVIGGTTFLHEHIDVEIEELVSA